MEKYTEIIEEFKKYVSEKGLPLNDTYSKGNFIVKSHLSERFYRDVLEWGNVAITVYASKFLEEDVSDLFPEDIQKGLGQPSLRSLIFKETELTLYFAEHLGLISIEYNELGNIKDIVPTMIGESRMKDYNATNIYEVINKYLEGMSA